MLVFWSSGYKALTSRAEVYARHIRSNAFDLRRNLSNTFTAKANVLQARGKSWRGELEYDGQEGKCMFGKQRW